MRIERTFINNDSVIHYCITDNVCSICKHNPKNAHLMEFYYGKCHQMNESVVSCCNFEKLEE